MVLKPIKKLREKIIAMGQLDFSQDMELHTRDEIGEMSQALNQMSGSIRKMIMEMRNSIKNMDENANDNSVAAEKLAKSSEAQYKAINNLSTTMNEMGTAIDMIVTGASDMADTVSNTATVIKDADSMIEQARAGTSGRGFAVVADEIRNLADMCSESVVQIQKNTSNIQTLVEVVFEKTTQSNEMIKTGGKTVYETEEVFNHIRENVDGIQTVMGQLGIAFSKVEHVSSDMAANTQKQTASTDLVLSMSEEIRELSEQFSDEGQNMNRQSVVMKQLSGALDEQVSLFKGMED